MKKQTHKPVQKFLTAFILAFLAAAAASVSQWPGTAGAASFAMASLNGYVFDSTKSVPVDGAQVTVRERTVKTDRDGRFIVGGLIPGRLIVEIRRKGYEDFMETVTVEKGENSYNVKMKPEAPAAPAAAAPAEAAAKPRAKTTGAAAVAARTGSTPFARRVPTAQQVPSAKTATASGQTAEAQDGPAAGDVSDVAFSSAAKTQSARTDGFMIEGSVRDISSKTPIAGAAVVVEGETCVSAGDGSFRPAPQTKRMVEVRASADGYIPFKGTAKLSEKSSRINILLMPVRGGGENIAAKAAKGETGNPVTALSSPSSNGAVVRGRITGAKGGAPLPDVAVIINDRSAKTDANGNYSIDGMTIGDQADISVVAGKYGVFRGKVMIAMPVNEHNVTLAGDETICSLNGSVFEAGSGKAVSGARIMLGNRAAVSDKSGNFFVKDLPSDYYLIKAEKAGYATFEKTVRLSHESENVNIELNEL